MLKLCFLYVLPDYRHKGYARELISAVEEYASTEMLSGVYATTNPRVDYIERFISSCGYVKTGKTKYGDIVFQHILW